MAKEIVTNPGAMYNALTNGSKIVGKIFADSDFRIDGEVEGTINCNGKVVIGQKGFLKGSISCVNAEVIGTVEGDIVVSETLSLRATAVIKGDVKTKVLMVEPNAIFEGTCSMREQNVNIASDK
ncbi:MAG: polymer-forming cytoskeletal protein [Paludibacter sp.]|nr:polymer-forming cytoskeletal protein [Paludibacter sp.]